MRLARSRGAADPFLSKGISDNSSSTIRFEHAPPQLKSFSRVPPQDVDERAQQEGNHHTDEYARATIAALPSPSPTLSTAEQLREMAALRDEGILTEEEFIEAKRGLLKPKPLRTR
jgi:hypothetical protein